MTMPAERRAALNQIAQVLWSVAWRFEGGKGEPPALDTLNARNQNRWFGAALATEHLMSEAKQDAVQQSAVINACIGVLGEYRDRVATAKIA
jgi:hypothetical protein